MMVLWWFQSTLAGPWHATSLPAFYAEDQTVCPRPQNSMETLLSFHLWRTWSWKKPAAGQLWISIDFHRAGYGNGSIPCENMWNIWIRGQRSFPTSYLLWKPGDCRVQGPDFPSLYWLYIYIISIYIYIVDVCWHMAFHFGLQKMITNSFGLKSVSQSSLFANHHVVKICHSLAHLFVGNHQIIQLMFRRIFFPDDFGDYLVGGLEHCTWE